MRNLEGLAGHSRKRRWGAVTVLTALLAIGAGRTAAAADLDGDGIEDEVEADGANPTDPLDPDSDDDDLCDGPADVPGICVAGEDLDADGTRDEDETDPNRADTDGGGTADGVEVLVDETDPLDPDDDVPADGDRDGLPDDEEGEWGTDPELADTDADGLLDGTEVFGANPTDPTDADSDGDGLCDGPNGVAAVCAQGEDGNANGRRDPRETDPNVADTDGGGVSDGREVLVDGTNPLNPQDDGTADSDGDGLDDGTERELGTNPDDPDSDHGGVDDGREVARGTDPRDPSDDRVEPPDVAPDMGVDLSGLGVRGGSVGTCSALGSAAGEPAGWPSWLLLTGLGLWRRRRSERARAGGAAPGGAA